MTMATNDMSDHSSSEEDEDEDVDLHDADEPMYDSDDGASFTEHESSNSKEQHKPRSKTAADAEFLDTMDQNQNVTSITDLHRSNLLRLQTQELVTACQLDLQVQEQHVQWADVAHGYVSAISALIETIPATTIQHSKKSPFPLQSDKKDLDVQLGNSTMGGAATATSTASGGGGGAGGAGGVKTSSGLQVEATGCYQAGIGLTVPSGNANVLPTLDLVVKLPNSMFDVKDYIRHRYFDVRTVMYICMAMCMTMAM
jgi:hypothetical protein